MPPVSYETRGLRRSNTGQELSRNVVAKFIGSTQRCKTKGTSLHIAVQEPSLSIADATDPHKTKTSENAGMRATYASHRCYGRILRLINVNTGKLQPRRRSLQSGDLRRTRMPCQHYECRELSIQKRRSFDRRRVFEFESSLPVQADAPALAAAV